MSARRPTPLFAAVSSLVAGLIAACGGDATDAAEASRQEIAAKEPADEAGPVACGAPLPGPPLAGGVEATAGFAAELEAIDTSSVPDPYDFAEEGRLARGLIGFMLGRVGTTRVTHAEAQAAGILGRVVLAAAARGGAGGIDVMFLRRGLYHGYLCSRPLPRDLGELVARYGDYHTWPAFTIPCARPKDGPRRIYEDEARGVFVAETLGDGGVRETEVLFSGLRADGQLDFAAYTADGALTDRSTFATGAGEVTSAAPFTCMSCHLDVETGTFTRRFPSGTGAGCSR